MNKEASLNSRVNYWDTRSTFGSLTVPSWVNILTVYTWDKFSPKNFKNMKTYNENSQELMMELVKFSIFYILFIITVNGFATQTGSSRFQDPPGLSAMQSTVRKIYTSQIGIREKQPNSGPAVEAYLRYVNLAKGNPWCAAFVCWVYGKAGVVNPRSGWSPDLFPASRTIFESGKLKAAGLSELHFTGLGAVHVPRWRPSEWPQPGGGAGGGLHTHSHLTPASGDIFGLYFPEKRRIAHVGFIDQWDGIWMISVEGNTNVSGSREGDGVYRKRRLVKTVYKVARYISDAGVKIR